MSPLVEMAVGEVQGFALVFARVGAAMMVMPLLSESYVSPRHRLSLALFVSAVIALAVGPPPLDPNGASAGVLLAVGKEALFGLFVGAVVRAVVVAAHFGGSVIAMQTGLGSAMVFDPSQGQQSSLFSNMLLMLFLALIVSTDLYHHLFRYVLATYDAVPLGADQPLGGMAELATKALSEATRAGLQLAAPLLVAGIAVQLLMGVLNRLMPSLQVLFVAMPVQIMLGMVTLALSLGFVARTLTLALENAMSWPLLG